jgi:hypothetical protein
MIRRALSRLLCSCVPLGVLRPTAAPYAVRFSRSVVVGVPGLGLFEVTHEQAKALAAQLSPSQPQS